MATKSATTGNWQIEVLEDGKVEVTQDGVFVKNVKDSLREISEEVGFEYEKNWNTRQFGKKLVNFLLLGDDVASDSDYEDDSLDAVYERYNAAIEEYKSVCKTDVLRITQKLTDNTWATGYPVSVIEYDDDNESEHEVTKLQFKENGIYILEQWLDNEIVTTDPDRPLFIGLGCFTEYQQTMEELTSIMERKIELYQENAPSLESIKPDYLELNKTFREKKDDVCEDYDLDLESAVKVFTLDGSYVYAKNVSFCPAELLEGPAEFYVNDAVNDDDEPVEYYDMEDAKGDLFAIENLDALEEMMENIREYLK